MRRFIKFTSVLLIILTIAVIISSTTYSSILGIPFSFTRQLLKDTVLSETGQTKSTDESYEDGGKPVPDDFIRNNSVENIQNNQRNERDAFEGDGAYYRHDDKSDHIIQDIYRPHDTYSHCDSMQHYDLNTGDDTHTLNVEEAREGSGEKEFFITIDEVKSLKNMKLADKLKAMAIISKIDRSNIERIYRIAEGGVSYDEMEEINMILKKSLTSHHIKELSDIINRNKKLFIQEELTDK